MVVGRVYLGVADVGDAKNLESESESELRGAQEEILESTATPKWFGDGRVSGNQPGEVTRKLPTHPTNPSPK